MATQITCDRCWEPVTASTSEPRILRLAAANTSINTSADLCERCILSLRDWLAQRIAPVADTSG